MLTASSLPKVSMLSPISPALAAQSNATGKGSQKDPRKDVYLEMMRAENPNFSSLESIQVLSGSVELNAGLLHNPGKNHNTYKCITQRRGTIHELYLGINLGNLTLWKSKSVIKWVARADGYLTPEDAIFAARGVQQAAQAWNKHLGGRVTFEYTPIFDDACFQVLYGGDDDGVLASAFFPDDYKRVLNELYVFKRQFDVDQRSLIANTMAHELGHVIGLRHEHSQEKMANGFGPEDDGKQIESILYGPPNPLSVMAYYRGQQIQPSDVEYASLAYDSLKDGMEIRGTGRFKEVVKKVKRVDPNN